MKMKKTKYGNSSDKSIKKSTFFRNSTSVSLRDLYSTFPTTSSDDSFQSVFPPRALSTDSDFCSIYFILHAGLPTNSGDD